MASRRVQLLANLERKYGLPQGILYGQWGAESGFAKGGGVKSSAGAVGPFQFLPETAAGMGVNPRNFASAAKGAARYDAQYKDRGFAGILAAYNAGPAGNSNNPETQAYIRRVRDYAGSAPYSGNANVQGAPNSQQQTPAYRQVTRNVLDRQGFQQAEKEFTLGQILRDQKSPFDIGPKAAVEPKNPLLSILPQTAPSPEDFTQAQTTLKRLAGGLDVKAPPRKGVADFGGVKVAGWIAPILQYAKAHGWTGSVTSGFRSFAEQKRIYDSGVRPAAVPGTSNHEGTQYPRGAVDVTDAKQLAQIIARSPYRGRLVWAGAKDQVHFSHPHGGSY